MADLNRLAEDATSTIGAISAPATGFKDESSPDSYNDNVTKLEDASPTLEEMQRAAGAPGMVGTEPIPPKSLVIKTKKPRPYVCPTCTRSFARLEHLKRHERSHTKEKPFQCMTCERSFARRDLLLRHKQKLHASFSPGEEKEVNKEKSTAEHSAGPIEETLSTPVQTISPSISTNNNNHASPQDGGWMDLTSRLQSFDAFPLIAPPLRVSTRSSRASSFSAASSTTYLRQKDLEAAVANSFTTGPTDGPEEVGFATPQAYATDDRIYDFEPLDLNYVDPMQLQQQQQQHQPQHQIKSQQLQQHQQQQLGQPPPRKRRASMARTAEPGVSCTTQGGAVQALRQQVQVQRQLYHQINAVSSSGHHLGVANMAGSPSTSSQFGMDARSRRKTSLSPMPLQLQYAQQQQAPPLQTQLQQQQLVFPQYQSPQHSQPVQQQFPQYNSPQHNSPHTQLFTSSHESLVPPHDSFADASPRVPLHNQNDISPPSSNLAYGMTPGLTPGMTPGMVVPNGNMQNVNEETAFLDFLAKQGDDFVNSLFDLDDGSPDEKQVSHEKDPLGDFSTYLNNNDLSDMVNGISPGLGDLGNGISPNMAAGSYLEEPSGVMSPSGLTPPGLTPSNNETSTSGLQRYVDAYFKGFDTHLSFVHRATPMSFNASLNSSGEESPAISPPSSSSSVGGATDSSSRICLSQAQAAIGAQALGERGAAQAYYWAARDQLSPTSNALERMQGRLLVVIWGLFSDDPMEHEYALRKLVELGKDADVIASGLTKATPAVSRNGPGELFNNTELGGDIDLLTGAERLWEQFVVTQTHVRTLHALHAVCTWVREVPPNLLHWLKSCGCAPSDDDLWRAPTSDSWLRILASRGLDARTVAETGGGSPNQFTTALNQLLAGQPPVEDVTQTTLQSLLLAIQNSFPLTYPCSKATLATSRNALRAWEMMWARFPEASLDPSPQTPPVINDCVGVVSLVAFSSLDLNPMLGALWRHDFGGVSTEIRRAVYGQQGLLGPANYAVDTLVWCEGHVTSQSIFFTTILAVAECGFVLAEALRCIAAKTTPLSSTEEQLVQRSRKLISNVLRMQPPAEISALPNRILRSASCLVRLSDWPLVGVLSRSLLAHASN